MALTKINNNTLSAITGLPAGVGGKVLQVVQVIKTDTFSTTSTSLVDITGLTLSITPSATSSKILVLSSINGSQQVAVNRTFLKLLRGSTGIFIGDAAGSRVRGSGSFSGYDPTVPSATVSSSYLDSPNTTSAVTYKWQIIRAAGGGTSFINRASDDADDGQVRMASTITLMEIGA